MNTFWTYFWPIFGAGFLIGVTSGLIGLRSRIVRPKDRVAGDKLVITPSPRRRRQVALLTGFAAVLASAALWHGPLGAADRLATTIERQAREALNYYEVPKVTAHLHRGPLSRELIFTGPADDFQRGELVRLFGQLPGVHRASWSDRSRWLPLIAEGILAAIAGFLPGLLVAYVFERRRRYNAQWTW
jgi:hypothetical protein